MPWRVLLVLVVWWFAFGEAATYGAIWHGQAHPTRGVELVLNSGAVVTGDLTPNWDKSWALVSGDGTTRIVQTGDWRVLRTQAGGSALGPWQMWRSWGPVGLVTGVCVFLLMLPAFRRITPHGEASKTAI